MYHIHKANISDLLRVEKILYRCGRDMAQTYGLQHWNNSHMKNAAVVALCVLKNSIYLVVDENGNPVATFQTHITDDVLCFQKLATDPVFSGRGVGSFCIRSIEELALESGCRKVCCEVYDRSLHAINFYEKRGYTVCGSDKTLKYTQLQMEKQLRS